MEIQALAPQIPHIIKHCATLEAQVDKLLEQRIDDHAKLAALKLKEPTEVFAFLNTQFERKDAIIEKLKEENKTLHEKLRKKTKKYKENQKYLFSAWDKNKLALSALKSMHDNLNLRRAAETFIYVGFLGYLAHKSSRYLMPHSTLCDTVITCATIGIAGYRELKRNAIEAGQEKALII